MLSYNNISVIILAGGKSRRMKCDKRLLKINGKSIIQITIELAQRLSNDVIISANDTLPDFKNIKTVKDFIPGKGPMIGLISGLKEIKNDSAIVLTCDMPLISPKEIDELLKNSTQNKITVWKSLEQIQPMPGIYPKSIFDDCLNRIENNERSIVDMIKSNNSRYIELTKEKNKAFLNINYPEDFSDLLKEQDNIKC